MTEKFESIAGDKVKLSPELSSKYISNEEDRNAQIATLHTAMEHHQKRIVMLDQRDGKFWDECAEFLGVSIPDLEKKGLEIFVERTGTEVTVQVRAKGGR